MYGPIRIPRAAALASTFLALCLAVSFGAVAPPSNAAAAVMPTVDLRLQDFLGACLSGTAAQRVTVKYVWQSADGDVKAKGSAKSDAHGAWAVRQCSSDDPTVEPGDSFKLSAGGASRTFTVPGITLAANRVTDTVMGRAPAGTTVKLELFSLKGFDPSTFMLASKSGTVAGDGTFAVGFSGTADVRGGDSVSLTWVSAAHDSVTRVVGVPYVQAHLGDASIVGVGPIGQAKTIDLADSSANPRATAIAVGDVMNGGFTGNGGPFGAMPAGQFDSLFVGPTGRPVHAHAGDEMDASALTGDDAYALPALPVSANAASDVVAGKCGAHEYVQGSITWEKNFSIHQANVYAKADGGGAFSLDFTSQRNLVHGDAVDVSCMRVTGDVTVRTVIVP